MCEYCEKEKDFEVDNEDFSMGIDEHGLFTLFWQGPNDFNHFPSAEIKFKFCPMCGRKLV